MNTDTIARVRVEVETHNALRAHVNNAIADWIGGTLAFVGKKIRKADGSFTLAFQAMVNRESERMNSKDVRGNIFAGESDYRFGVKFWTYLPSGRSIEHWVRVGTTDAGSRSYGDKVLVLVSAAAIPAPLSMIDADAVIESLETAEKAIVLARTHLAFDAGLFRGYIETFI